jgi:hypothetical protein
MNKLTLLFCVALSAGANAQSFPGPYGEAGSTAIPKDSSCFVGWATGAVVQKGYLDINDTNAATGGSNRPTFGELEYVLGPAQGNTTNVLSLGDAGVITLTFGEMITNGSGWDFAVFENGFTDGYMELAHVEVSSDGGTFFRFPSTSEIATTEQVTNFTIGDCREVDNLAGKYRNGFGTPFDLDDIPDNLLLDKMHITHVRIIDAVGSIGGNATTDQYGTKINDPYPTVYPSGGFDLDAVGVINQFLGTDEHRLDAQIWPNPALGAVNIKLDGKANLRLVSAAGSEIASFSHNGITVFAPQDYGISAGVCFLEIRTEEGVVTKRIVISGR